MSKSQNYIPEIINNFHLYKGTGDSGDMYLGLTGEVTLPDLEAMKETVSGSGLLGEVDVANPGHYSEIEMEIPFVGLCDDMMQLSPNEYNVLTMRAAQQATVKVDHSKQISGMKVVIGGTVKKYKLGTVKIGGQMGSSVTLSVTYIKITVDDKTYFELDKYNEVFIFDGNDMLAKIKSKC